jgi:hypothetical protein
MDKMSVSDGQRLPLYTVMSRCSFFSYSANSRVHLMADDDVVTRLHTNIIQLYKKESVNRSQMDIKRKACDIRT